MNRTQIYLSESQHAQLTVLAKQQHTTTSALIRSAIDGYLAAQLSPEQRLRELRDLASRVSGVRRSQASEGAEAVERLRSGDSQRLPLHP
jgi:predicted DNA-binding protein